MARQASPSEKVRDIDEQIQKLIEQKARIELEKLIPLRKQYLEVVEAIGKMVAPHGLTAARYLQMSPEEAETFILERSPQTNPGVAPIAPRKKKVPPKYRHPKDEDLTWTGRGNSPIWVRDYLGSGGTLEELLIDKGAAKKKPATKRAAKKKATK